MLQTKLNQTAISNMSKGSAEKIVVGDTCDACIGRYAVRGSNFNLAVLNKDKWVYFILKNHLI